MGPTDKQATPTKTPIISPRRSRSRFRANWRTFLIPDTPQGEASRPVFVIIGAAGGIGSTVARRLYASGARLTGVLCVCHDDAFIQVLEGSREEVNRLDGKLLSDD